MVNFQEGLARLTLTARAGESRPSGAIFLQAFALADGSICLKASLTWQGSDAFPSLPVFALPDVDWRLEATRIAKAWGEGPSAALAVPLPVAFGISDGELPDNRERWAAGAG